MITIFTIPKPFVDSHIDIIQQNAIKSWMFLGPDVEVILVGNDIGVGEIAKKFGIKHIPNVLHSEFGTPLINSAFDLVRANSKSEFLVYLNADIILFKEFLNIFDFLPKKEIVIVGRRTDLDVKELIPYEDQNWERNLKNKVKRSGKLHSAAGIDYFIFRRDSFKNLPTLIVGRVGWDNWLLAEARKRKMLIIDATDMILAIHQNHDDDKKRKIGPEALHNISLIKNSIYGFTIEDADWRLTKDGLKKRWFYWWPFIKRGIKSLFHE